MFDDEEEIEEEIEPIYLKGEYWFDDSGTAMYADGDVGDMNHEAYVQQYCVGSVLSQFDIHDDSEYPSLETHEDEILEQIVDNLNIEDEEKKYLELEELKNDPASAIIDYLEKNNFENASDTVFIAYGSSRDAREFAIKNWGWSRVHGKHIEVQTLNSETLRNVKRGIENALEQEGQVYSKEDEIAAELAEYFISTYTGKRYSIKLGDMSNPDNISDLEPIIQSGKTAAGEQLRNLDLKSMNSYYQDKGVIGDSFKHFFHKIFLESSGRDLFYSWLSPNGEFFKITSPDTHQEWAQKFLASNDNVLDTMFRKGWFRITRYGDEIGCHNNFIRPSGKPFKQLIDTALENNMSSVEWDNEEDSKIIWTNSDY